MVYFIWYKNNNEYLFKFGDVKSNTNYDDRLKAYKTHNPDINDDNFVVLNFHGNYSQGINGTDLKNALKEKGVSQEGNKEWFRCSNILFIKKIIQKIKQLKNGQNYLSKEGYEELYKFVYHYILLFVKYSITNFI